jgi:hypothetical protein
MNNLKQFEAFDGLETLEASKLGYQLGYLPQNVIPVVMKDQIEFDFTIYLATKEEFVLKGSWWKVQLAYSSTENNIITVQNQNHLLTYSGLSEYPVNLVRLT